MKQKSLTTEWYDRLFKAKRYSAQQDRNRRRSAAAHYVSLSLEPEQITKPSSRITDVTEK